MNQNYLQDPLIFIRIQMENAWDDGDLENALRLSRMIGKSPFIARFTRKTIAPESRI